MYIIFLYNIYLDLAWLGWIIIETINIIHIHVTVADIKFYATKKTLQSQSQGCH